MFLENRINSDHKQGWIEVVTGSMFSGKTEELLRRLRRAKLAKQDVRLFKPKLDTRYSATEVVSHDAHAIAANPVEAAKDVLVYTEGADVVAIDEAQFFDNTLIEVCQTLANNGIRVIIAGLDMDYTGKPFGPIPQLMAIAEDVQKVHAICVHCGGLAQYSHRISGGKRLVVLGETNHYEPLCRRCFVEATQRRVEDKITTLN